MKNNNKKIRDIGISISLLIILNLVAMQPISKNINTSFNLNEILLVISPGIVATIATLITLFSNFSISLFKKILIVFGVYTCSFFITLFFLPLVIIIFFN